MTRILITSALPYINGVKHLGTLAGSMLSADVFARFKKAQGFETLFICATDEHGTPTELAALEAGKDVRTFCDEQHLIQKRACEAFDLGCDHFGRSSSPQNHELTQHFARLLPDTAAGAIITLLDQRVWSITPHFVSYTVAKAGLWALTQSMALALAPRIRVHAIGPGPTLPSPRQSQEQFDRQAGSVPLHHGTSPEEIGRAALAILALPSMTGQMLALDGGQHLQWAAGRSAPPPEE